MGVPKFFRWLSERYPKINQRYGSPPEETTYQRYFDSSDNKPPSSTEQPDPLSTCGLPPEIDRLYIDMNGIIHGCSHNNSNQSSSGSGGDIAGQEEPIDGANNSRAGSGTYRVSNEEIFRNVCYYLDRIIGDMIQPKQVVYMAIDGVAPRAKMNQQRSRRYRSGREGEIETNIYDAHARLMEEEAILRQQQEEEEEAFEQELFRRQQEDDDPFSFVFDYEEGNNPSAQFDDNLDTEDSNMMSSSSSSASSSSNDLKEVSPGRFQGKFEAHVDDTDMDDGTFHSNVITPGTPFFTEFTKHLEHFVKYKLSTDPKWKNLTIIFSGPNVPGEGEHKIMQFIREQREKPNYDPNLRHCIMGQDGDLIMLGLCTHEPNLVLFRERVIFSSTQRRIGEAKAASALDSYIHNAHFEFLHMGVLRDYLAYEFETSNVISGSPWDLERTIDDFVLLSFLCGNDFLPHLPAIDIGDHAFDLLFWSYKTCRKRWLQRLEEGDPYLTFAGSISSGRRLEEYLATVGSHEVAYYDKKKQAAEAENTRLRKQYKKLGMGSDFMPDDALVASKEESDRAAYRKMLQDIRDAAAEKNNNSDDSFTPVMTGKVEFQPVEDEVEEGLVARMGNLLQNSLSSSVGEKDEDSTKYRLASIDDQDLKGRYYYDKFQITPFDADKHLALRRAYIEGLVWNLKYYYEGCVSWEWYYPYHYGPMLSDLVNLDEVLDEIKFEDKGRPLNPFEQLLGCMPPSQAHHIPEPYRWLMTDPASPIIDFYPTTFTVDMNGKRWPWEAVVLLPFIDSKRLLSATSTVDQSLLTEQERQRNSVGTTVVMMHDLAHEEKIPRLGDPEYFQEIKSCKAITVPFEVSDWNYTSDTVPVLKPQVKIGTTPKPGFSSLRDAPVQSLWRRKMGLNIFGGRSRYKTASLEISSLMPPLPPVEMLAPKLIGTSIFVNYPHFVEGLVTAVSDKNVTIRGKNEPRKWTQEEANRWALQRDGVVRRAEIGEGINGSGGLILAPDQPLTLSVRPLQGLVTTKDGTVVKSYAKFELEVPLVSSFWTPSQVDPRLSGIPSRLEKNAFEVAMPKVTDENNHKKFKSSKGKKGSTKRRKLFPPKSSSPRNSSRSSINGQRKVSAAYYSTLHNNPTFFSPVCRTFLDSNPRLFTGKGFRFHSTIIEQTKSSRADLLRLPTQNRYIGGAPISLESTWNGKRTMTSFQTKIKPVATTRPIGAKGRLLAATFAVASFFFAPTQASQDVSFLPQAPPAFIKGSGIKSSCESWMKLDEIMTESWMNIRGGDFENASDENLFLPPHKPAPPIEFAHGTTTLSFTFQGGIIVAVDSRASMGSFVGSKTVQKVLPISSHMLGTMAGGAADCQHWIRTVKSQALLHELTENGQRMSVARASRSLSNIMYELRKYGQVSVGTMIAGWDHKGPQIYYVDSSGVRIQGDVFAVGSGGTFALGILDTETNRQNLTKEEAIALGTKAIRHATFRDAYSGGYINVYLITPEEGWEKVYTEDIARSPEVWKALQDEKKPSEMK